jgi:DNA-binding transcriptional LysR family regulator
MNVELRHLRYFLAVADELHFGRAAAHIGIAQPALSQQIRRLENEVGTELFHRSTRQVKLSAAGEALAPYARRALEEAAAGAEAAARASRGEVGHLTVGFIETAATALIPQAVRRFRSELPDVTLTLRELGVAPQVEAIVGGRLDVGFVRPPVSSADLRIESVGEERLIAALPSSHPLSRRRRIKPDDLIDQPLVALSRETVPGLHDQVIGLLGEHGGVARITQEATSIQAVLGLVAAELGTAVLPSSASTLSRDGVAFVQIAPSPTSSMLAISSRTGHSPLVAAFVAAARGGEPGLRPAGPGAPSAG